MNTQQNRWQIITRMVLVLLLAGATAWIVLQGRTSTAATDQPDSRCGGCRYATECLKQERILPVELVKRCHSVCQLEDKQECKSACCTTPKAGGCHED